VPAVGPLLEKATAGDAAAWEALVDEFGGMVWGVARSFGLDAAAASDVAQTTWLRLVEHASAIRDPAALPGWLATTARREALRLIRRSQREVVDDVSPTTAVDPTADVDDRMDEDRRRQAVVGAFGQLNDACQQLLRLLSVDPPLPYAVIADMVGRPIGSIGPTRARCLERLRSLCDEDH
jgi:RNA polymerase sigma factor (sigma-70 family)